MTKVVAGRGQEGGQIKGYRGQWGAGLEELQVADGMSAFLKVSPTHTTRGNGSP